MYRGLPSWYKCVPGSSGVLTSLLSNIPLSTRRSIQYCLWQSEIPLDEWATSNPRKYLRIPKSLTPKLDCRVCFTVAISSKSFPINTISSTYTISAVIFSPIFLTNKEWSKCAYGYPYCNSKWDNFSYHCLLACFKPYKDLISLHTWFAEVVGTPEGRTMKTYSWRSPCKKALLTSNWCTCH